MLSLASHCSLKIPTSQKVCGLHLAPSILRGQRFILTGTDLNSSVVCLSLPQGLGLYRSPEVHGMPASQRIPHNTACITQLYLGFIGITYGKIRRHGSDSQEGGSLDTGDIACPVA